MTFHTVWNDSSYNEKRTAYTNSAPKLSAVSIINIG